MHSAALIGEGSEVLGFDTPRSADHDWGPRLQLFLRPDAVGEHRDDIGTVLAERLPAGFLGYPTNLAAVGDGRTRRMQDSSGRRQHGVVVAEPSDWFRGMSGSIPWP